MGKYIVGITGASCSIYGKMVVEELVKLGHKVYLVVTEQGEKVFAYEMDQYVGEWIKSLGSLVERCYDDDFFTPIASGSFPVDGMVIVPCSMGSLAKIANGISDSLLTRSGDVCIKEKRKLIIVPRETPLSTIHLENMLKLSRLGVEMVPPMPEFYSKPKSVDQIVVSTVGRILERLGIANELYMEWQNKN